LQIAEGDWGRYGRDKDLQESQTTKGSKQKITINLGIRNTTLPLRERKRGKKHKARNKELQRS